VERDVSTDPGAPLDDLDAAILDQLHEAYAQLDPPPPSLAEQVCFALELENIDVEVAQLRDDTLIGSGARGASRSRTLTFETDEVSLLISVTELGTGLVRLDGWLAPAGFGQIELRTAADGVTAGPGGQASAAGHVTPDEAGRFLFDGLRPGLVQLRIEPLSGQAGRSVITPSIRL
jgi:hypothetical protein